MDLTESPPRAYKGSENTLSTPTRTGGRKRDHEEVEPLLDSANANRTYGARKMPAATSPGRKRPAVRSQDESGSYDSEDYGGQRRRDDELASIIRAKLSDPSLDEELKKKVVEVKRITFRPMNAEAFTHPKGRNNDLAETVNEGTVVARSNLSKAMTREQLREEINGLRNGQQGVSYSSYKDGVPNRKGKKKPKISACWPPHPNPDSKAADVFEFCLICAGLGNRCWFWHWYLEGKKTLTGNLGGRAMSWHYDKLSLTSLALFSDDGDTGGRLVHMVGASSKSLDFKEPFNGEYMKGKGRDGFSYITDRDANGSNIVNVNGEEVRLRHSPFTEDGGSFSLLFNYDAKSQDVMTGTIKNNFLAFSTILMGLHDPEAEYNTDDFFPSNEFLANVKLYNTKDVAMKRYSSRNNQNKALVKSLPIVERRKLRLKEKQSSLLKYTVFDRLAAARAVEVQCSCGADSHYPFPIELFLVKQSINKKKLPTDGMFVYATGYHCMKCGSKMNITPEGLLLLHGLGFREMIISTIGKYVANGNVEKAEKAKQKMKTYKACIVTCRSCGSPNAFSEHSVKNVTSSSRCWDCGCQCSLYIRKLAPSERRNIKPFENY